MTAGTVYLIHFERRLAHAGHYLGFATDLEGRLEQHRRGGPHHARLMEVIHALGIGWTLARVWPGGRDLERRLKRRKCGPRLCPLCGRR